MAENRIEAVAAAASTTLRQRRRAIVGWCVYDWANSAFPAVISTFVFPTYFSQFVAPDPVTGMAGWAHALALAGIVIAMASPPLGAIADRTGRQKLWLALFSALNVALIALLWFVRPSPESIPLALIGIALATIAFEIATIFYNALLPAVAPPAYVGRVSGWGWGLGYVGGIVCLSLILALFVRPDATLLGLDRAEAEHIRIAALFSALWYAVFALPIFVLIKEPAVVRAPLREALREGLVDLARTLAAIRRHRNMAWFLLAHMIYADGLTTLFAFGGIYAAGTFGMDVEEVLVFGIALNVAAGTGALAFAWVDDWIGSRRTIVIGLVALIAVGISALSVESKGAFWALGVSLGVFFGPVQAASRSLVARLSRPEHRTQMFGLFALSGRITAFAGPAVLGWVTLWAGSQRAGLSTVMVFLLAGLVLLWVMVQEPAREPSDA